MYRCKHEGCNKKYTRKSRLNDHVKAAHRNESLSNSLHLVENSLNKDTKNESISADLCKEFLNPSKKPL